MCLCVEKSHVRRVELSAVNGPGEIKDHMGK